MALSINRRTALAGLGGFFTTIACQKSWSFSQPERMSLGRAARHRGLMWGAAVKLEQLESDPGFRQLVVTQANLLVPEVALKWDTVQPVPGRFNFGPGDRLLQIAQAAKLGMRGHTLVWHQQLPPWVLALNTKAAVERALATHIETLVAHYRERFQSWDVINEPIADDGKGLRDSLWLRWLGERYLEQSLRWAHQADPTVPLVINDFGLEDDSDQTQRKRQRLLQLLRRLRDQGVPLQAIGLQAHLYAAPQNPTFRTLPTFLAALADLNLDVYVTELDVNDRRLPAALPERDLQVAAVYRSFLKSALTSPRLRLIATWGLSDRYTWLNSFEPRSDRLAQRPLPFSADLAPKAAYCSSTEELLLGTTS
jgi:endo-1,4-beta-xylanase